MDAKKLQWEDYRGILFMVLCAAIFGVLLATGVIDIDTIPQLVAQKPFLAFAIIMAIYVIKGFSGVIIYNAVVIAVSLIYPMWLALLVNGLGTALTLSISYLIGSRTKTDGIESLLEKHPKLKKYFSATQQFGFVACFAIHMAGLNMEVLGVIFGILRIGFWKYLVSSWLAIMPGMICFTIAGNELSVRSPVFWIVLGIDLLLMAFGFFYTKKNIIANNKEEK